MNIIVPIMAPIFKTEIFKYFVKISTSYGNRQLSIKIFFFKSINVSTVISKFFRVVTVLECTFKVNALISAIALIYRSMYRRISATAEAVAKLEAEYLIISETNVQRSEKSATHINFIDRMHMILGTWNELLKNECCSSLGIGNGKLASRR